LTRTVRQEGERLTVRALAMNPLLSALLGTDRRHENGLICRRYRLDVRKNFGSDHGAD
jgi:hypothetical protein